MGLSFSASSLGSPGAGFLPVEWGQPYSGGTGKALSRHTAASGPRSSHPHKLELPHLMCIAGKRPTQRGRKPGGLLALAPSLPKLVIPDIIFKWHLSVKQWLEITELKAFSNFFLLCLALSRTKVLEWRPPSLLESRAIRTIVIISVGC